MLAEKESDHYFAPASSLKIFTAVSALKILGKDFQFKTDIFFNAKAINHGVLKGDVNLVFSGDPLLKIADVQSLLMTLKNHGVHQIDGRILLIANAFDDKPYGSGWPWDQLHICYSGPVNTINLDANCFLFHVFSTKIDQALNLPASVDCSQRSAGRPCVLNKAVTRDDPNCILTFDHEGNAYRLSGCLSPKVKSERMKLSIPDTALYLKTWLSEELRDMGIRLNGKILMGQEHPHGIPVATHSSYPLKKLVRVMLKYSDDLVANALFKAAGAHYYHAQGTWQRGINAEKAVLKESVGFSPESLFIFDGSGESYYNAVTPQQMVKVLMYIHNNRELADIIIPGLPVNGTDGTLVARLKDYPAIVHAKTGTWRDVSSLSGYVLNHHTRWVFAVFVHGMTTVERGDAHQVDAWMRKVLPLTPHTTKHSATSGKPQ
ncbi:MAG: D-alanyl-D-alanine carboxypeptidase/D-alanyl-D-alanine-endopeptidase [Gammaproteobacteria bacterium]|nr:D-alanyl-D-alanine carboxypeptidase/D-alanyl-D-alanine-endopeptidase [Gammaproteobacteria bacterium]MCD8542280.1 D-alanyl-D-alanine carboxypeptidase/D-alanyl-D-alanine-endopeptidase [Gammaproteobacteria bacterium]